MSGRSVAWFLAEPAFEDERAHTLGVWNLRQGRVSASDRRTFRPPFDVYETEERLVVKVEVAGMREEDFCIWLDGHILNIAGTRRDTDDKLAYHRIEVAYGDFHLGVRLPHAVAEADIQASYDRGFLEVSIPRRPQQRRIPITETTDG